MAENLNSGDALEEDAPQTQINENPVVEEKPSEADSHNSDKTEENEKGDDENTEQLESVCEDENEKGDNENKEQLESVCEDENEKGDNENKEQLESVCEDENEGPLESVSENADVELEPQGDNEGNFDFFLGKAEREVDDDSEKKVDLLDDGYDDEYELTGGEDIESITEEEAPATRARSRSVTIASDYLPDVSNEFIIPIDEDFYLEELKEECEDEEPISDHEEVDKPNEEYLKQSIDRAMYYEMHALFSKQHRIEKLKNNYLQSQMAIYYTRRKMTFVLREQLHHTAELQTKYERELDALERLIDETEREKSLSYGQVFHLTIKCEAKTYDINQMFQKLQHDELEYGIGLTYEKTGRHNMDKIVDRFVKRQKTQMALATKLNLCYIKLRNKISEKVETMEALDHLGPGFRIMDYAQLISDKRDLHDKLDEKETELMALRACCQNTMQILAHNREKSTVMDVDIARFKEELETVNSEYEEARENLHYLKQERDGFRTDIKELKLQHSLFINRKLLRDMEHSLNDLNSLKHNLETVKTDYHEKGHQLKMVRKNIDYYIHQKKNRSYIRLEDDESSSNKTT